MEATVDVYFARQCRGLLKGRGGGIIVLFGEWDLEV